MLKNYQIIQNGQISDRYASIIDEIVEQIKIQITRLLALRNQYIASGGTLLSADEIDAELEQRRGRITCA